MHKKSMEASEKLRDDKLMGDSDTEDGKDLDVSDLHKLNVNKEDLRTESIADLRAKALTFQARLQGDEKESEEGEKTIDVVGGTALAAPVHHHPLSINSMINNKNNCSNSSLNNSTSSSSSSSGSGFATPLRPEFGPACGDNDVTALPN